MKTILVPLFFLLSVGNFVQAKVSNHISYGIGSDLADSNSSKVYFNHLGIESQYKKKDYFVSGSTRFNWIVVDNEIVEVERRSTFENEGIEISTGLQRKNEFNIKNLMGRYALGLYFPTGSETPGETDTKDELASLLSQIETLEEDDCDSCKI